MKLSVFKSLQFRMPLIVLSGIIPLISVASFYATENASKKITQEATENLDLKSILLAENIQDWNESNELALLNLSQQPDIIRANPNTQQTILAKIVNTYEHLYLAHTINLQGWNISRSDGKKPQYYGDRNYFQDAIAGNPINYQTIISRTTKQPSLCMSSPTIRQEEILAVTSICTDLTALTEQVGKLRFGQTGYAFIVDQNADLLVHPDPALISGSSLTNLSQYPPVKNILEGNVGNFFSFTDDNNVKWVSHSILLDNNWAVVVLQEEADFFASKIEFQKLAFFINFVVIVGTSALTFFLANRLIEPIRDLSEAAITISEGNLDQKVNIKREDELGILAFSFNHMATQLKKSFEELQQTFQKLEKAKEEAVLANQSKDQFLANISHEFRTPLNSVLGYAKLLQRDQSLDADQIEQLNTIQQSGTYILTLINDILDLAKSQTGKMELHLKEFDLLNCLNGIIRIVEREAKDKGLKLKTQFKNLPNTIIGDQKRLTQVLMNLLNNGIKFTSSGEILLKVTLVETTKNRNLPLQQKIRFEVIDTGKGISSQELKKIFQPFEQVGNIESRYLGTGLGLSISQQLVELMGGTINVKSKLGKGSNFWFEVVFSQETISSNKSQQPYIGVIEGYKGRKRKLLVVDDRKENRLLLANILEPIGFKVLMAENGEHMFTVLEKERPDLIFLDLLMPVKTGFTSAKQLQQESEYNDIPIIILSACSITPEMRRYVNCKAFLNKPFEEEELLELLAKYLHLEWIYRKKEEISPIPSYKNPTKQPVVS
ncbi:MAG: ATP-binding protein [Xenococcaceae cyanobacterium MO_167.B27]|nr:ATP-binding protein [Xenococcaceae cyanobacterium MO_167.B27]